MRQQRIEIDTTKEEDKERSFKWVVDQLHEIPEGKYEVVIRKRQRTSKQNRAMHVFFRWIAEALNEAHMYFEKNFFKDNYELEWSPKMVKELIWRPIQMAKFKKKSTTKLTTSEFTSVADAIQANFFKKGVILSFPSIETVINNIKHYEIP